jgi:hypothetical protein
MRRPRIVNRISELVSFSRKLFLPMAAFMTGLALPPGAIWLATRGHGATHPEISDLLRVDPGRDELHTWRWGDPARDTVRLPIDLAIDRYVRQQNRARW